MQPKIDDSTRLKKNTRFSATLLPDGNWIFFDAANNEIVVTTPTAGILWELCSGDIAISEIVREISKMYPEQKIATIRRDVSTVIPQLLQKELLTIQ